MLIQKYQSCYFTTNRIHNILKSNCDIIQNMTLMNDAISTHRTPSAHPLIMIPGLNLLQTKQANKSQRYAISKLRPIHFLIKIDSSQG